MGGIVVMVVVKGCLMVGAARATSSRPVGAPRRRSRLAGAPRRPSRLAPRSAVTVPLDEVTGLVYVHPNSRGQAYSVRLAPNAAHVRPESTEPPPPQVTAVSCALQFLRDLLILGLQLLQFELQLRLSEKCCFIG